MNTNTIQAGAVISVTHYCTGFHDYQNQDRLRNWTGITAGVAVGYYIAKWLMLNPPKYPLLICGIIAAIMALRCCVRVFYRKGLLKIQTKQEERFSIDRGNGIVSWIVMDEEGKQDSIPICRGKWIIGRREDMDKIYYEIRGPIDKGFVSYGKTHFSEPLQEVIYDLRGASVEFCLDRYDNAPEIEMMDSILRKDTAAA